MESWLDMLEEDGVGLVVGDIAVPFRTDMKVLIFIRGGPDVGKVVEDVIIVMWSSKMERVIKSTICKNINCNETYAGNKVTEKIDQLAR